MLPKVKQDGRIMFGSKVLPNHSGLRITLGLKFFPFHLRQRPVDTDLDDVKGFQQHFCFIIWKVA